MKVVATRDAAAAGLPGVSAEMEALLSMMDEGDRKQYLAWMAMHAASMREGLLDRAARAVQRMEALGNKCSVLTSHILVPLCFHRPRVVTHRRLMSRRSAFIEHRLCNLER